MIINMNSPQENQDINHFHTKMIDILQNDLNKIKSIYHYIQSNNFSNTTISYLKDEGLNKDTESEDELERVEWFSKYLRRSFQLKTNQINSIKRAIESSLNSDNLINLSTTLFADKADNVLTS